MDWNSDGDADLVSGDRNGYFNVWVWRESAFEAHTQYLATDSTPINVGYNSFPAVLDWNGDGKKDLLLGCENGQVLLWRNVGEDTWPMFESAETLAAGRVPLYQYRVNPFVVDLDCDGVRDLACGDGNGYVLFYRNLAGDSNPVLTAGETLRTAGGEPVTSGGTVYGSRCWFGFWDGDTVPDILLSAYDGTVELFRGTFPVGVEEGKPAPGRLALRARPNPFAGRALIAFGAAGGAELVICDNLGRVVRHLGVVRGDGEQAWDGSDDAGRRVSVGVYVLRLAGSGQAATARIVVGR